MKALLALVFVVASVTARAQDFTAGGEGELYLQLPMVNATTDSERMEVRSVELTGQASLDDLHAKLTVGADDNAGDFTFNVREAYAYGFFGPVTVRAGRYYLPIGLLNQQRRSAWPFVSAPTYHTLMFGPLGVVDTGLDLAWRAGSLFELRVGATNGYRFDADVTSTGDRPVTPTNYVRPEFHFDVGDNDLNIAADYLGRVDSEGEVLRLIGADIGFAPKTPGEWDWSGQAEFFDRYQNPQQGLQTVEDWGAYVFASKGLGREWLSGLRLDLYKIPSLVDEQGNARKNLSVGLTPMITYRGHKNLLAEISYTLQRDTKDGDSTRYEQLIELRATFELGDLPVWRTPRTLPGI